MKDIRIVFMGTPDFAVAGLQKLVESNYKIVGVITAPDRPAGRGQKLRQSAVKQYALANDLTILQPTNLKDEDFIKELKALDANLQIVVAFRMLPKIVWTMPKYGTFNLHASLLPDYRGAAPINWAIINGETKTGTTTFFIDEKIDTGAIILQQESNISLQDNAGDLHDRLMISGSNLILQTVKQIEAGSVTTQDQPKSSSFKEAPKLTRNNTKIEWDQPIDTLYNLIRGLSPYPVAWSYLINGDDQKQTIKIHAASILERHKKTIPADQIGKIISKDGELLVQVINGILKIEEIQLPGKRKMAVKDLLNGYHFNEDAKML